MPEVTRDHRLSVARAWLGPSGESDAIAEWVEFGKTGSELYSLAALERLAQLVADAEGAWIPCEERLPEPGVDVLVFGKSNQDVSVLHLLDDRSRGWYPGGWGIAWTSHWRPLPAAPCRSQAPEQP